MVSQFLLSLHMVLELRQCMELFSQQHTVLEREPLLGRDMVFQLQLCMVCQQEPIKKFFKLNLKVKT